MGPLRRRAPNAPPPGNPSWATSRLQPRRLWGVAESIVHTRRENAILEGGGGSLDNLSPRCQCQSVLAHTLRVWHHLLVSSVGEWCEIGAGLVRDAAPVCSHLDVRGRESHSIPIAIAPHTSGRARQRVPFHTHSHSTAYEFYFDHLHFHFGCWPPYRDFGGGGARIQ